MKRYILHICFICKQPITKKEKKIYLTKNMERHVNCKPGSSNWIKSEVGKTSQIKDLYRKRKEK